MQYEFASVGGNETDRLQVCVAAHKYKSHLIPRIPKFYLYLLT